MPRECTSVGIFFNRLVGEGTLGAIHIWKAYESAFHSAKEPGGESAAVRKRAEDPLSCVQTWYDQIGVTCASLVFNQLVFDDFAAGEWSPLVGDSVVQIIDLEDLESRTEHDDENAKPEVPSSKDKKCAHLIYQDKICDYVRRLSHGEIDSKQGLVWRSRHGISIDKSAESATALFFLSCSVEKCSCGKSTGKPRACNCYEHLIWD